MSAITATFHDGIYNSYLDGKLQSFPYYDQETKSIKYHPAAIYPSGEKQWYNNGKLHSFNDEPSVIEVSRRGMIISQFYHKNGELHRDGDKPAYISKFGAQKYYKNGEVHRDGDKPAFVYAMGESYYVNGKLHRDGDTPAVVAKNGDMKYYKNGKLHRDNDKPAVIKAATIRHPSKMVYYKNGVKYVPLTTQTGQAIHIGPVGQAISIAPVGHAVPVDQTIPVATLPVFFVPGLGVFTKVSENMYIGKHHLGKFDNMVFTKSDSNGYICRGKIEIEDGVTRGPFPLTDSEIATIKGCGYRYYLPYCGTKDSCAPILLIDSSQVPTKKISEILPPKQTPPVMTVIKNPLEVTHEDAIKFLLTCEDLEHHERRDLIKQCLQKNNIVDIEQIIKFLLGCVNITQSEKQEVLRLLIKKE